jgi:hypothetical protein
LLSAINGSKDNDRNYFPTAKIVTSHRRWLNQNPDSERQRCPNSLLIVRLISESG